MGAATAILACRNLPDVNVIACDSPYSSLKLICQVNYRIYLV